MFILVLKESTPTLLHGRSGNSVPYIGSMRSLRYFSHVAQFSTTFEMFWEIPGRHSEGAVFASVLVIP